MRVEGLGLRAEGSEFGGLGVGALGSMFRGVMVRLRVPAIFRAVLQNNSYSEHSVDNLPCESF